MKSSSLNWDSVTSCWHGWGWGAKSILCFWHVSMTEGNLFFWLSKITPHLNLKVLKCAFESRSHWWPPIWCQLWSCICLKKSLPSKRFVYQFDSFLLVHFKLFAHLIIHRLSLHFRKVLIRKEVKTVGCFNDFEGPRSSEELTRLDEVTRRCCKVLKLECAFDQFLGQNMCVAGEYRVRDGVYIWNKVESMEKCCVKEGTSFISNYLPRGELEKKCKKYSPIEII